MASSSTIQRRRAQINFPTSNAQQTAGGDPDGVRVNRAAGARRQLASASV